MQLDSQYYDDSNYFRYASATLPGSSGAPVCFSKSTQVLGVHVAGVGDKGLQNFHAATRISAINEYILKKPPKDRSFPV